MHASNKNNYPILADGRWSGTHGIGCFSSEVLSRLKNTAILTEGPKPLSLKNLFWQSHHLQKQKNKYRVFFTPGFNPVIRSPIPFVFTIHDLIHLYFPGNAKFIKKIFYELILKPISKKAAKILTVSEFSKKTIIEWANIPAEKIIVVKNGIKKNLTPEGIKHSPGYPYLLHTGNTKAHKNIERLLRAFSLAKIDHNIKLILTGQRTTGLQKILRKNRLEKRIIFTGTLSETELGVYYRGATALIFPSLYEGFGLPVIEAMACGTPVLTSDVTSLPEVAGNAALLIDPYEINSIACGIEEIVNNKELQKTLIEKGFQRTKLFSWDETAEKVQEILNEIIK